MNLQSMGERTSSIPEEMIANLRALNTNKIRNLSSARPKELCYNVLLMNKVTRVQSIIPKISSFFRSLFFRPPSHTIYYNLCIISTIHVQVRFQELLLVPSNTSQNHQLVTVRLLDHCSGITFTLMRPENQLGGI